jgi:hypothetical protein
MPRTIKVFGGNFVVSTVKATWGLRSKALTLGQPGDELMMNAAPFPR